MWVLLATAPALAVDGVAEINQACATTTGCFAGDAAGFPVTITGEAGRSYRLTSDLGVSGSGTHVIEVNANNTTIDMGGFRIVCSNFVPPATVELCSVTGSGSGSGVVGSNPATSSGVEVRNGSIIGMPGAGLVLGPSCMIRNLRVSQNGLGGIACSFGSIFDGNIALNNGSRGIFATAYSVVSRNIADENGTDGILGVASTFLNNNASDNGAKGIDAGIGSVVTGNSANTNGEDGIFAGHGSTVSGNAVGRNRGNGIFSAAGCTVSNNSASVNVLHGLRLSSDTTGYHGNTISSNTVGSVLFGTDTGGNLCDGSTTCP